MAKCLYKKVIQFIAKPLIEFCGQLKKIRFKTCLLNGDLAGTWLVKWLEKLRETLVTFYL